MLIGLYLLIQIYKIYFTFLAVIKFTRCQITTRNNNYILQLEIMKNIIKTSNAELIREQLSILDKLEWVKLELLKLQLQKNQLKKRQAEINNKLTSNYIGN